MKNIDNIYLILKKLNNISLNQREINYLLVLYSLYKGMNFKFEALKQFNKEIFNRKNNCMLKDVLESIESVLDVKIFILSLKLISIKPLIIKKEKLISILNKSKEQLPDYRFSLRLFYYNFKFFPNSNNLFFLKENNEFIKELSKELNFLNNQHK